MLRELDLLVSPRAFVLSFSGRLAAFGTSMASALVDGESSLFGWLGPAVTPAGNMTDALRTLASKRFRFVQDAGTTYGYLCQVLEVV
jgi:hypothetical protein